MLYNGASEFVNEFSVGLCAIIFNMVLLGRIGSVGVASYSIIQYVTMISMMTFFGIAQASQPGLSYNLGAGKLERIRSFKRIALVVNVAVSVLSFIVLIAFNRIIASVFYKRGCGGYRISLCHSKILQLGLPAHGPEYHLFHVFYKHPLCG